MAKDTPSLVRLKRVAYFLQAEDKYKTLFTEEKPFQKGNEAIPFPTAIWNVAQAIIDAGIDPCQLGRAATYGWADHILLGGPAPQTEAIKEQVTEKPAETEVKQVSNTEVVELAKPAEISSPAEDFKSIADDPAALPTGINVRVAIYTLLLAAHELTRLDRKSNAEELRKQLEVVANKYRDALPNNYSKS